MSLIANRIFPNPLASYVVFENMIFFALKKKCF